MSDHKPAIDVQEPSAQGEHKARAPIALSKLDSVRPGIGGGVSSVATRNVRWLIIAGLLLLLVFISGLFWMRLRSQFVLTGVPQGVYVGQILLVDGARLPLAIDVDGPQGTIMVLVPGFQPVSRLVRETEPLVMTADAQQADPSLPQELLLSGRFAVDRGAMVGTAESGPDEPVRAKGRFVVAPVEIPQALTAAEQQNARAWVLLQAEYQQWLSRAQSVDQQQQLKQQEIVRLTEFVKDRARLRQGADEKYQAIAQRLEVAEKDLSDRRQRAQRLAESLALAQRVTPFGRLVTLGRESSEREMRWVESMLRAGGELGELSGEAASAGGVAGEVARGREIIALKRRINAERSRIIELGGDPDAQ